jgi:hypothetical protein
MPVMVWMNSYKGRAGGTSGYRQLRLPATGMNRVSRAVSGRCNNTFMEMEAGAGASHLRERP